VSKLKAKNGPQQKTKYPELTPLWIGMFCDILGFYIIIPFLPTFIEVFNTTPLVIGFLLATNAVFTLVSAPIWGRISDKIGRKPVLLISQAGTFMAFLMLAFSDTLELLFLARIVDGIFGGNFPMVKAIISDKVPPKDRGVQMTNVGVVFVLAGLVGPGLGGILSVMRILGPQYPVATAGIGASLLSLSTIFITFFFIKESWTKSRREHYEKQINVKIKLRKNKDATYLMTLYAFHTLSFMMYITTVTLFLGVILGLKALEIGIVLTFTGIARAIVRFTIFKPTLKLLGPEKMTKLGLGILFITFFLTAFVRDMLQFIILMLFVSYGVACSRGLLISKITQTVKPNEMGKINGYTTTIDSLAQIAGPITGAFILTLYDPSYLGITLGLTAVVAFIMFFKKIVPLHLKQEMEYKQV